MTQEQRSGKAQDNQQPAEELRGDSPGGGLADDERSDLIWADDVDPDYCRHWGRLRRRSKREWGEARALRFADQRPTEPIANTWLITGPDSMARGDRHKLWSLKAFHRYSREGVMDLSREAFLEKTKGAIGFDLILRYEYHPKKLEPLLYANHPFLDLLPRRAS